MSKEINEWMQWTKRTKQAQYILKEQNNRWKKYSRSNQWKNRRIIEWSNEQINQWTSS